MFTYLLMHTQRFCRCTLQPSAGDSCRTRTPSCRIIIYPASSETFGQVRLVNWFTGISIPNGLFNAKIRFFCKRLLSLLYLQCFIHFYCIFLFAYNHLIVYIKYSFIILLIFIQLYGFKYFYSIQIIFKQIYLTHRWKPIRYYSSRLEWNWE